MWLGRVASVNIGLRGRLAGSSRWWWFGTRRMYGVYWRMARRPGPAGTQTVTDGLTEEGGSFD